MKTVQDYLDLGLVFVGGDKCFKNGASGDEFNRHWHERPAMYSDKLVSSFAWRNNDGVKPEYKGLIEVEMKYGSVMLNKEAGNLMWSLMLGGHYIIAKWRPVVLQSESDDLKNKLASEISSSMGSACLSANGVIDVLSEAFKPKPPFWNKSMQIFSCPCVAVNAEAIKTKVSLKETNPMKPVYTAEMHAKNELPQVDSKVKVCIKSEGFDVDEQDEKFEGKTVTVRAAFNNAESEKIVAVENEDGNCACYIIECIKPIIETIKVNGFDVPAPMSEAPKRGAKFYIPSICYHDYFDVAEWIGDENDILWISRGIIHSTKSAAIAHAKAMLGIDPNA